MLLPCKLNAFSYQCQCFYALKNTAFENETRCAKQVRRVGDNKKDCTITAQSLSFLLWNEIILQHPFQV